MKRRSNPFSSMQNAAVGMAGLGVTGAVISGISSKAPAGTPSMSEGFNTLTGFVPIAATAIGGKAVLDTLPKGKRLKY